MKISNLKLACVASAVVMLCAAGGAQAGAYALSSNNVRDFNIITTGSVTFGNSVDTSSASAILNGVGAGPTGGTGFSDAPIAVAPGSTLPAGRNVNNSAFPLGLANVPVGPTTSNYSYADALITHAPGGLLPFTARTIAESHLQDAGTAFGTSTNSSATGFQATFTAGAGSTIDFSFVADPLIRTFLQQDTGFFAQGTLSAALRIVCSSLTCGTGTDGNPIVQGEEVFAWAPNGIVGGAGGVTGRIGGVETADAENLQASVSNFNPPGGPLNFSDVSSFLAYDARTGALGTGTYTLTLAMTSTDSTIKVVPEPSSIALLGLGLSAVGFASRRRSKV